MGRISGAAAGAHYYPRPARLCAILGRRDATSALARIATAAVLAPESWPTWLPISGFTVGQTLTENFSWSHAMDSSGLVQPSGASE
jgi:hypothetical protein